MASSNRISIAHCIDSFEIGGTELNAARTVEALDRERFDLTVFHLHRDGPLRSRYESCGVRLVHLPIATLYAPSTQLQALRFARFVRRSAVQVVHTHDIYTNIFAAPWACVVARRPVIASRRWLFEAPRRALVPLNRWSYRFATRVIANSDAVAKVLVNKEGVPHGRVFVLRNFLGGSAFEVVRPEDREAQRARWGVPPGAFLVGCVARLAAVKNHSQLLHAARLLDSEVHVVLIGDGPERAELQRLVADLQIQSRVHFVGQLLTQVNMHQFFDASVLCSRSEGFPNSVIEAMAAACPVIATPVGGVVEVVRNNQTGMAVPVGIADVLAACIQRLRDDPAFRSRLAGAALALVREEYSQTGVISKLSALYEELAARSVGSERR